MNPDEIRQLKHESAANPERFRQMIYLLAVEAVAQIAEGAEHLKESESQQLAMIDAIDGITEECAAMREALDTHLQFRSDPQAVALFQDAVAAEQAKGFSPREEGIRHAQVKIETHKAYLKLIQGCDPEKELPFSSAANRAEREGNHD